MLLIFNNVVHNNNIGEKNYRKHKRQEEIVWQNDKLKGLSHKTHK